MQVQTMRKRRREGNARAAQWAARVGSRYTIQPAIRWLSRTAGQVGPTILFECPAQIPGSSPSIFFLLAPLFCGDECSAQRALGWGRRGGVARGAERWGRQRRGGGRG